jgi:benzoate-CoA ligase family
MPGAPGCNGASAHYNAVASHSSEDRKTQDACDALAMTTVAAPPAAFNLAADLLARNAARGDRVAYIDDRTRLTYGALQDAVQRFASSLRQQGLRREERVLLLAHDSVEWPVAFLGAIHAGIVPVAVNTLLTADDYAYMLSHSRARAAIVSAALLPTLERAMQSGAHEVETVWIIGSPAARSATRRDFNDDVAHSEATAPCATHADEAAFWLYSSGSTGAPKGTVHTHANAYWTDALYARAVLRLTENDVCLSAAKLFFAYGLGNALTFPLAAGATTVLMAERATPPAVFQRLVDQHPTVFFGVPTLYAAMLASPALPPRSSVALRVCVSAGEALPRDIGERFTAHFGCEILDGIGSTEMLHIFLSNRAGDVQYGTTGVPVDGYDVELRAEDGRPVADGEVGDLYIRGPSAALMYWTDHDKSRATFQGAWTRSGDKYTRRADGYYVYAGRADDMLKVSGLYVSPFEVEAALVQHPAVLEAAVIGKPDAAGLTKTKAFVVLKPGHDPEAALADTLKSFVKDKLAPYKYPREIEFIAELPKTATGKIQRFRLRERERA